MGAGNMQADPVCLLCSLPLAAHAARDACAAFVGQVAEGSGKQEQGLPVCRPGTRIRLECRHRAKGCLTNRPVLQRGDQFVIRSEEHTSELPSLMRISSAVFCLKKKNNTN